MSKKALILNQKPKACEVHSESQRRKELENVKLSLKPVSEETKIKGTAMDMLIG